VTICEAYLAYLHSGELRRGGGVSWSTRLVSSGHQPGGQHAAQHRPRNAHPLTTARSLCCCCCCVSAGCRASCVACIHHHQLLPARAGNHDDYWRVLWDNGKITKERLESMHNPIKGEPVWCGCVGGWVGEGHWSA
jgi:hypothetical protein